MKDMICGIRRWRLVLAGILALVGPSVFSAVQEGFLGKVKVEWDDSDDFNRHKVTLLADFGFRDPTGKEWIARQGTSLDGSSFTPLFEQMVGQPFVGEHRRAGILHDFYARELTENWRDVRRMYYAALLSEGLTSQEAKTAYAILYGAGLRWEKKGSTCYVNCHSGSAGLTWKPDVTDTELESALEVLENGNPTLDEIDRAVDAVIPKPGPHLFSQLRKDKPRDAAEDVEAEQK